MNTSVQDSIESILKRYPANFEEKKLISENRIEEFVRLATARQKKSARRLLISNTLIVLLNIALVAWSSYQAGTRSSISVGQFIFPTITVLFLIFRHLPMMVNVIINMGRFESLAVIWLEQSKLAAAPETNIPNSKPENLTLRSLFSC